ncbi:MAG: hypothetical protein IJY62_04380 [Clostridia bacterium]|nr:hypothetical protein [Clostridia bacterium]
MKSFKNYRPQQSEPEKVSPQSSETGAAAELTKKIASAWNGKSSNDMLMSILSEAEKSKREGRLTNAEIDEFYAQFSPLLDQGQRKKLKLVVERLKRI